MARAKSARKVLLGATDGCRKTQNIKGKGDQVAAAQLACDSIPKRGKAWLTPSPLLFACCSQWPHLAGFLLLDPGNVHNLVAHFGFFWSAILLSSRSRPAALLAGLCGFCAPWLTATSTLGRAWFGLAGWFIFMRLFQILTRPADFEGASFRCRLAFSYWIGTDLRTATVMRTATERSAHTRMYALRLVQGVSICTVSQLLLTSDRPELILPSLLLKPWKWTLCLAFFYNSLLMLDVVFALPLALAEGVRLDPMMVKPFQSVDLQDFWANRWDRAIQTLLKDCAYVPLRKLGCSRDVAVIGTFVASAFLHTYGIVLGGCYDLRLLGSMMAFFCLQPVLLKLEAWTKVRQPVLYLASASILFLEPVCQLFDNLK